MATDERPAQDGDTTSWARGNSLYSTENGTSWRHFSDYRTQVDAIVMSYVRGHRPQSEAYVAFVEARTLLVERLTTIFLRRLSQAAAIRPLAEAPADIEPPSAGPG